MSLPSRRATRPHRDGCRTSRPAAPVARLQRPASAQPDQPRRAAAEIARAKSGVRMTRRRQTIATRLVEAQHTAAMLTTFNEIDMTAVMELRKRRKEPSRRGTASASASCPSSRRRRSAR